MYEAGWHLTPDQDGTADTEDFATAVIDALGRRSESQNYTEATMQAPSQLPSEEWLDAALAGATVEEVFDDDGSLTGWWAENLGCPGASAYGSSHEEARTKLRDVLRGWFQLGQELDHPIPSIREGEIAADA